MPPLKSLLYCNDQEHRMWRHILRARTWGLCHLLVVRFGAYTFTLLWLRFIHLSNETNNRIYCKCLSSCLANGTNSVHMAIVSLLLPLWSFYCCHYYQYYYHVILFGGRCAVGKPIARIWSLENNFEACHSFREPSEIRKGHRGGRRKKS